MYVYGCVQSYPQLSPTLSGGGRRRSSFSPCAPVRPNHQTLASAMASSATETRMPSRRHRRYNGSFGSSRFVRSPAPAVTDASRPHSSPPMRKRISSTDPTESEIPGEGRPKRSSPVSLSIPTSYPTWVILHRVGARRDFFHGDGTTSAPSYTSGGDWISVSFELETPPRTSLLTLDWPQGPCPSKGTTSYPHVIAAHRNLVLLEVISPAKYPRPAAIDYFVYKSGEDQPSLTRLPVCWNSTRGSSLRPRIMSRVSMGLLSCTEDSFMVADLERISPLQPSEVNLHLLCSGSNKWRVMRDVPIRHADGIPDLDWWSTDMVLPFRRRCLIWVDYLRGIIIANMTHRSGNHLQEPPLLQYVRLPVDPILKNPYDSDYGRGCPQASRSLCATHRGIKFVNINQHGCITLWSLLENQTWREDAALDVAKLWDLDLGNRIPHVQPEFPVVDIEYPYVVCFLLNEENGIAKPGAATWMIKVHMKKKILLDFTDYSNKGGSSSSYQETCMITRRMSKGRSFISAEMPCFLSAQTTERRVLSKLGI